MTGPEHYTEAERLLLVLQKSDALVDASDIVSAALAGAQVHATLALVAATAMREDGYVPAVWSKAGVR